MGKFVRCFGILLALLCLLAGCAKRETPPESSSAPPPPPPESSQAEEPDSGSIPGVEPALAAAVEQVLEQYKNGTLSSERYTEQPEGFVFPGELDWNTVRVTEREGMTGGWEVAVPSVSIASSGEGFTVNGEEQAVLVWSSAAGVEEVWFRLNRTEVPIQVDADELVVAAVAEMIEQYKNGAVTPTENIPVLPEGFVFPEEPVLEKMNVFFNDIMGDYQVTVPSAQGEQTATFICRKFAVLDDNNNDTGDTECHVAYVLFQ